MKTSLICLLAIFSASSLTLADGVTCRSGDVLGSFETQGISRAVEVVGTTAFVLDSSNLHVVDISDPLAPSVIGSTAMSGVNIDMKRIDSTVYIANRNTGLVIVDVSVLNNPTIIGLLDNLGRTKFIDVVGTTAYLANDTSELHIIDVSTPSTPALLGTYTSTGTNREVAVVGSRAYLASTDIHIIDVSDPAQPVFLGLYDTVGTALDISVIDTTAFIAESFEGLSIVDMSDASSPSLISRYPTDGYISELSADGSTVYAIESTSGLSAIDVSDLTSPSFIGSISLPTSFDFLSVGNGLAALAGDFNGTMQLVDVSNLDIHAPVASLIPTFDMAINVATAGNYAYVTDRQTGLLVYDITTPLTPILISTTKIDGSAYDIAVQDSIAYVCGGTSGIHIFDISTPSAPFLIGHNDNSDFSEIVIEGQYLYALGLPKIGVFDVSDPTNPLLQDTHQVDGYTSEMIVRDSIIYLASGYTTLDIFDATDPKSIQRLHKVSINSYPEFTSGIALMDNTLFISTDSSRMRVFDVSTPASPSLLATYPLNFNTGEMAVDGTDLIMIASGLQVYDASNPLDLQWKGSQPLFGSKLTLGGSHAFVASGTRGFYVVDISDCDDCTADFTGDGTLDFFDVSAFLGAFAAQDPIADFNDDGAWNYFDVSAFLAAFSAGCP